MLFRDTRPYFYLSMALFLSFNFNVNAKSKNSNNFYNPNNNQSKIHISSTRKLIDNFHSVESGKLYRSKQLYIKNLNRYIKKLGIKTIVNLRGKNKNQKWWNEEKEIAKKNKVLYCNISMNANNNPNSKNLKKLFQIYNEAPKPILIHCHSGIDRTGEAAALWILNQQNKGKKEALKQLSIKYGYLKWFHPAKKQFIKNYNQAFLQEQS